MRLGLSFHKVKMIANLIVQVEALRIRMPATQFIKMYETSRISTTSIAPVTVLKEENTNC